MAKTNQDHKLTLNLILASTLAFASGNTKKGMQYMAFAIESPNYKSTIAALDDAATADDDQDVDADGTDNEDEDAADENLEDDTSAEASFRKLRRSAKKHMADVDDEEDDEEEEPKPAGELDAVESRMSRAKFNMKLMAALDGEEEPTDDVDDADGDSDDDLDEEEIKAAVQRAFKSNKTRKTASKKPAAK